MLEINAPVIYFNIQGEKVPRGFITVYSGRIEPDQLLEMIADGAKINLVFTDARRGYDHIAGYILNLLMDAGYDDSRPIYLCLDECHLLKGYSLEIAKYVATAGLKKGLRLICITQRPALCDKTLYTQAFEHYIFFLSEAEAQYMKNKGIDYGFCKGEWDKMGEHSYCYYNGYELQGRPAL